MSIKTFIVKSFLFILLFIIADQLTGVVFRYLNNHAGDKFERENYMRYQIKSDMIILGSSRAAHHYVPSILEDSLGLSVYNCGQRGNGIIYEYGRLQTIYHRYTPKVILVDIIKGYDLDKNDNAKYLDFLKPDYGRNLKVDSIFYRVDKLSPFKMFLNSYRYNSTICDLVLNTILKNRNRFQPDGYAPLYGRCEPELVKKMDLVMPGKQEYDNLKLYYLKLLAKEKKENSILVFIISPFLKGVNSKDYEIVKNICLEYNVPLLDYSSDRRFLNQYNLYKDGSHLNHEGAELYTSIVSHDVKKILAQKTQ